MPGTLLPYRGVLPKIGPRVFVAPTATVIGDTEIGDQTNIWFGCTVRGDVPASTCRMAVSSMSPADASAPISAMT